MNPYINTPLSIGESFEIRKPQALVELREDCENMRQTHLGGVLSSAPNRLCA